MSSTEEKIDPRKLLNAIQIAEERFVRTTLGYDLYVLLAGQKNVIIDSENLADMQSKLNTTYGAGQVTAVVGSYANSLELMPAVSQELWNEHLWKYIAECVHFVAMPEVYANFTTQGIMKNHPLVSAMGTSGSEAASVSLGDIKWLMDKWMGDRIETLANALHQYFIRNIGSFPNYVRADECKAATAQSQPMEGSRKVGWITNLYDDDENCGCRWS